ncbi:MAG: hypothetical protein LV473_16995 [Nitrospira sp.]|nr:hypothetical protein [Nitrospira sp.]
MAIPSEFRDSLKAFSLAAIEHLRQEVKDGLTVPVRTVEIPVQLNETTRSSEEQKRHVWGVLLYQRDDKLLALSEYHKCDELMRKIPAIEEHLNRSVGHMGGLTWLDVKHCLFTFVEHLLDGNSDLEFEEDKFVIAYEDLSIFFEENLIEYETWVPLENLMPPDSDIRISSTTTILRTPREVFETIFPIGRGVSDFYRVMEWETMLRIQWSGTKTINEPPPTSEYDSASKTVEHIITGLRLFKAEGIRAGDIAVRPRRWSPISGVVFYQNNLISGPGQVAPKYVLHAKESESLGRIYEQLALLNEDKFRSLALALRRFRLGYDRHHPEDRLLDQMIAFEALYLFEINAEDRSEKRFRLSLRVAQFIAKGNARQNVYRDMKQAYDLRSEIVHGGAPKSSQQARAQDLLKHVTKLADYLRRSLLQFLELSQKPETPRHLVDWEVLLFPEEGA